MSAPKLAASHPIKIRSLIYSLALLKMSSECALWLIMKPGQKKMSVKLLEDDDIDIYKSRTPHECTSANEMKPSIRRVALPKGLR